MTKRWPTRRLVPWSLGLLTLILAVGWTLAAVLYPNDVLPLGVAAVLTLVVGNLLIVKGKGGLIGPVLAIGATAGLVYDIGTAYALASLSRNPALTGEYVAAWLGVWTGPILFLTLPVLLILFPDGRFDGGRRWFLPLIGLVVGLTIVGSVRLWGVPIETLVDWDALDVLPEYQWLQPAFVISFFGLVPPAVISLAWRYRRGDRIVRQQIKWVLLAAIVVPLVTWVLAGWLSDVDDNLLLGIAACAAPITIGVAVLRYRLYEIDRIVSRTVSYGAVVAILALWVAGVAAVAGAQFDEPWLISATTLSVVVIFNPLRGRALKWADRRFNRYRYDAEQVISAFARALRDEATDPEAVLTGWVEVLKSTIQPVSVGVWLR